MTSKVTVRTAEPPDSMAMAQVHVAAWQQTYRGLISDESLDDPNFVARREASWSTTLADAPQTRSQCAVAIADSEVVGIAMASPSFDGEPGWDQKLHVLYVLAVYYGTGAGALLLDKVLTPDRSTLLWVADPNPRAQAFYVRHGFRPDGQTQVVDGLREVRMTRQP